METDDYRVRCRRKHNIRISNCTDAAVNDAHFDFVVGKLFEILRESFNRTLNVCLDDDIKLLKLSFLQSGEKRIECNAVVRAELFLFDFLLSLFDKLSCKLFIAYRVEYVARARYFAQTHDLNGYGGSRFFYALALVVGHDSYTSDRSTGNNDVAAFKSTVLNKKCCDGTFALVKTRFDDYAFCGAVRVRLKLFHFSNKEY